MSVASVIVAVLKIVGVFERESEFWKNTNAIGAF